MKIRFVAAAAACCVLLGCTDSKDKAGSTPVPSAQKTPEQAIQEMCERDFGTAKRQQCIDEEKDAVAKMGSLQNVPRDLADRCMSVPNSRYSMALECIVAGMAPPPPPPKRHQYAMEENGEYGYEAALSENDKKEGKALKPMLLFRYLGEKNGIYTVSTKDGAVTQTAACKEPCEFIKFQVIYAGQVIRTETARSTGTAIVDAVLADARNGMLTPYARPRAK